MLLEEDLIAKVTAKFNSVLNTIILPVKASKNLGQQRKEALNDLIKDQDWQKFAQQTNTKKLLDEISQSDIPKEDPVLSSQISLAVAELFSTSEVPWNKSQGPYKREASLDGETVCIRFITFAQTVASLLNYQEEIPAIIFAAKDFNGILNHRIKQEGSKDGSGSWEFPQYREAIGAVTSEASLKALANQTNAALALSFCWENLKDTPKLSQNEMSEAKEKLLQKIKGPVERLFDISECSDKKSGKEECCLSEKTIHERFQTFASETANLGIGAKEDRKDIFLNIKYPFAPVPDSKHPELKPLIAQQEKLTPLIQNIGRHQGLESWREWFYKQLQKLREYKLMPFQIVGGSSISHLLGVPLGGNVLTPFVALTKFQYLMKKQFLLYSLKEYGANELKMGKEGKQKELMDAIQAPISSIDWSAIKMSFQVTPFGLFITAYSSFKGAINWLSPPKGDYYKNAVELINIADDIYTSPQISPESQLALLTILHLAGDPDEFVKIMTCKQDEAFKLLSKLMSF